MGLDMYLECRKYLFSDEEKEEVTKFFGNRMKAKAVVFNVKYWRKANAIHRWFVDNVQEGEDDCGQYWVPEEKLKELFEICEKILNSTTLVEGKVEVGYSYDEDGDRTPIIEDGKLMRDTSIAESLLPTQSGFFFGSTEYDEGYWMDILETRDALAELFKMMEENKEEFTWCSFYYTSSW